MTGAERPGPAEPVSPSGRDDPDERRPLDYGDDDDDGDDDDEVEHLWQVRDIQVGVLSGLLLFAGVLTGVAGWGTAHLGLVVAALLVGASTFVPGQATVVRDGTERQVDPGDLVVGDLMLVRPGERLATDGIVVTGRTVLDTSAITGESMPVAAGPSDPVFAGAINGSGVLGVEVTSTALNNSLARIVHIVEREQSRRGATQRLADRIAAPLVPGILVAAGLTVAAALLWGDPAVWLPRALVMVVAASPCALAISVPVTAVAAIGAASRRGILVKGGAALETLGKVRTIALDKTGTLTRNDPVVVEVVPAAGYTRDQVLIWAAALEARSEHPLAKAILAAAPAPPVSGGGVAMASVGAGTAATDVEVMVGACLLYTSDAADE